MAQLDPLLQALIDRNAQELVLADGSKPTLRCGGEMQIVSQAPLSWAQIIYLLSELSDSIDPAQPAVEPGTSFEYTLRGTTVFGCTIENGGGKALVRFVPQPVGAAQPARAPQATDIQASAGSGGTAEIDSFLHQMVELGASDLHLSAGEVPRIRLHGDMAELPERPPLTADDTLRIMHEIMPEHSRAVYAETRDADYSYEIPGLARFRVNCFTDRKGTGGVMRVIPAEIMTVEQLGLPPVLLRLCEIPKGLVLVTGPTGSGKSTTLATMVDHINRTRTDHIITIEDPIEFVHQNRKCLVNQREVHTHTDGFKPALRAALREDPDIVLVGEMRDLETIAIAIETAETGHLVFGTLHTSTACSTVDRIIDQFPADRQSQIRTMLAESLRGVVSQILLKRVGGGRVAAMEILVVSPAISNLIREGKTFQIPSLMQTGKKQGMTLLNDALVDLVKKKLVEPDEAYAKAVDKSGLAAQLNSAGFRVNVPGEAIGRPSS